MKKIIVDKYGPIQTIKDALMLVDPNDENQIFIHPGIYHEKIKITGHHIHLIGEDCEKTIISYDDYAKKIHVDGKEYNTFRTYTCLLAGDNLRLSNLTIENTSGDGQIVGQAVALATLGDMIEIDHCRLLAHQDTLFLGPLPRDLIIRYQDFLPQDELIYPINHRVIITNTLIQGDVDYVFGGANAYFENCVFFSLKRNGFVFAPSTELDEDYGFTIHNCIFQGESTTPNAYLARPWRDYGKVVIMNSLFHSHIDDLGFDKWNDSARDQTCRFYEYNNCYMDYHKYVRCYFSKVLNREQLKRYQKESVLQEKQ